MDAADEPQANHPLMVMAGYFMRYMSERLAAPDIEILALHQLSPELMEDVSRAARVVFIDASAETAPGELRCASVVPAETASPEAFTHHLTPQALMAAAHDRLPPDVLPHAVVPHDVLPHDGRDET